MYILQDKLKNIFQLFKAFIKINFKTVSLPFKTFIYNINYLETSNIYGFNQICFTNYLYIILHLVKIFSF